MDPNTVSNLLATWGYPALLLLLILTGVGSPIPEDLLLLTAGSLGDAKNQNCNLLLANTLAQEGIMGRTLSVTWWTGFVGAIFMLSVLAVPAAAQSIGVRTGVSVEPEQFYFGGHAQTPALVDRLHFRPNIEIGLGNETTIAAFNVEFAYQFRSPEDWNVYAGAGPALNIIDSERDTDAEAGFNVLVGVAHEGGLFAEVKVGAFDSPRLKLGVGYAFRWR